MDFCNKVLSKAPVSWIDVQKQLLIVMQTRTTSMTSNYGSSLTSLGLAINKASVKQCTDLLIKHIKNLTQAQVIDQLNNFAQSCSLSVYSTPSEEEPTTVNAFLSNEDFFFGVSISLSGEITDVKFSLFSEQAKKNNLLKEMFRTWNWDSLYKHIDGIKSNFILSQTTDSQVKANAYKAIQCLERDLNLLYQIELKYLEKLNNSIANNNRSNKPPTPNLSSQSKYLDKLVNQTPIGVFKRSELGEAMRCYYYLSPLDLIQHNSKTTGSGEKFDRTYNILSHLTVEQLIKHELGAYLTISLQSIVKTNEVKQNDVYKLADSSLLLLNENDESNWQVYFGPYLNNNLNFEKNPLFNTFNTNATPNVNYKQNGVISCVEVPGAFLVKFNKPIVMCKNTLSQLQARLGIETVNVETLTKLTPFFELLAKTEINNKILNDAYSVQLPDENQVYYITELDQPNCMGILIEKLLFTQPQDLVVILETLRKQLLFNELLLSCMKTMCSSALSLNNSNDNNNYKLTNYNYTNGKNNDQSHMENNVRILEIGLLAPFVVSIIMQHPRLLCYTTIEIDISQGNIETKFRDHNDLHNPNVISEIIRRCHSIPVTIRALLMKYKQSSHSLSKQKPYTQNNNSDNPDSNGNNNDNNNSNHSNSNNGTNHNNEDTNYKNNNNNHKTNGNRNDQHFDNDSAVFQTDDQITDSNQDLQITPRSLINSDGNFNFSPTATNASAVLNRLTPSRRDSYNRTSSTSSTGSSSSNGNNSANLVKTPSSIFEFSNVISEQKQQQQKLLLINKPKVQKIEIKDVIIGEVDMTEANSTLTLDKKNKEPKCANDENKPQSSSAINTPLLLNKNNSFQTPSPTQNKLSTKTGNSSVIKSNQPPKTPVNSSSGTLVSSANKKRKAPTNESQSTSTPTTTSSTSTSTSSNSSSTPNTITQPPSAKRKMTQNLQQPDFKRHTSLIEAADTSQTNDILNTSGSTTTVAKMKSNTPNNNIAAKKAKLKSSISSVDLLSTSSSSSTSLNKSTTSKSSENNNTSKKETVSTVVSANSNNTTKPNSNSNNNKKEKELSSSGVLTAALINSNSCATVVNKAANSKLTNSTNKNIPNQNNQMKKSQSNKQLTDSPSSNITPIATTPSNKQNTSLTTGSSSSGGSQPPMRIKPITEDGLKIRISKDSLNKSQQLNPQRSTSSSSINNSLNKTNSNSNLSVTEIALKQPSNSVFTSPAAMSSSINSINNTPLSGIQQQNSSNRTPSPSPLFSSITTPSPILQQDDLTGDNDQNNTSNNSLPKYEPPKPVKSINKRPTSESIYNTKPTSAPLTSSAAATTNIKPNTPPLPSSSSLASFALGLGTSFKASSFKIPHKSKNQTSSDEKNDNEDNSLSSKTPLSSSSPVPPSSSATASNSNINRSSSVGSPNKSTTPPQTEQTALKTAGNLNKSNRNNVSMPPPSSSSSSSNSSSNNNSRNSNSSPKWQASYSGNMSPRYNNNFDQTSSSAPMPLLPPQSFQQQTSSSNPNLNKGNSLNQQKIGNNKQPHNNQRSQSAGNRPLTPIPSQFSNHQQTNNRNINHFNKNQQTPLGPPPPPSLLAHPVPLMPAQSSLNKSIPSLMSFNNHLHSPTYSSKDNLMTPSSPSPMNEINAIGGGGSSSSQDCKLIKETRPAQSPPPCSSSSSASSIPQPPDSPVCETAPIVIPKLIPLERNLSTSMIPTSSNDFYNNSSNANQNRGRNSFSGGSSSLQRIRSKPVDIASPDTITNSEEDDDNLVIDLIPNSHMTTNSYSNRHIITTGSSNSMHSNSASSRNIKSPCILEEDLVSNEALIS